MLKQLKKLLSSCHFERTLGVFKLKAGTDYYYNRATEAIEDMRNAADGSSNGLERQREFYQMAVRVLTLAMHHEQQKLREEVPERIRNSVTYS